MHMTIAFNRAPSIEPSLLSLAEQVVHLYAAGRQLRSTGAADGLRRAPTRRLHAGSAIEDFGVTRDCEHQNDAPDDILHGHKEGAAMPDEGWAVPTQPRQPGQYRQRSAARQPFRGCKQFRG